MEARVGYLFRLLAFVLLAGPLSAGSQPFSLTIEAVQQRVQSGSQVELKLTLTNTSDGEIMVVDTNPWCDYTFEVRDSKGQSATETDFKRDLKCATRPTAGRRIIRILKPHESFEDAVYVNHSYDLRLPGDYSIQVAREIPKELGKGTVKSSTITITVTE
jgi:hypothetical protein